VNSEGKGQRYSVTIDTATGMVEYAVSTILSSSNILARAIPGVSRAKGDGGGGELNAINEDRQNSGQMIGRR